MPHGRVTSLQSFFEQGLSEMELNIPLVKNFNIAKKHSGNGGLHLNEHGTSRLAMKILSLLLKLPPRKLEL